jgi:hypothetical protein
MQDGKLHKFSQRFLWKVPIAPNTAGTRPCAGGSKEMNNYSK